MSTKVLFIAYYFPPLAASGSHRAAGFCRHLFKFGYSPLVLTAEPASVYPPIPSDLSLELVDSGTFQLKRLAYTSPIKQLLQYRGNLRRSFGFHPPVDESNPSKKAPPGEFGHSFFALRRRVLNRLFLFPDQQNPWIQATTRYIRRLPHTELPDIILATGDPWSSLVAANRMAQILNIPYVVDFRDPWIGNPKPTQQRGLFKTALTLERQVIAEAEKVVANTEELHRDFCRRYPDLSQKFTTITNGFEPQGSFSEQINKPVHSVGVELSHFGTVYDLRNPFELLLALDDARREGGLSPTDLRIRFVGTWGVKNPECEVLVTDLENRGFVIREPAIPHDECIRRMHTSDCLLILQQIFPLQIPAKIYEYISVERPIILVGGDGATKSLVERNQLGLTCQNNRLALRKMLLELAFSRQAPQCPSSEIAGKFKYEHLTKKLADVLDSSLETHRAAMKG